MRGARRQGRALAAAGSGLPHGDSYTATQSVGTGAGNRSEASSPRAYQGQRDGQNGKTVKPYPILDASGKAHEWLRAGRGLVIWESHDIGAGRPNQLTPADHVTDEQANASHDRCTLLDAKPILGDTPPLGTQRAPVCRKPHWAYMPAHVYRAESEVLFYLPGRIVQSWNDSAQGTKAAQKALAKYPDAVRDAPIGKIYTTYTLHHYAMVSAQITSEGVKLDEYGTDKALTDINFRIGIREWSDEASMHNLALGRAKLATMNVNGHAMLYWSGTKGTDWSSAIVTDWSGQLCIKPTHAHKSRHNIAQTRWDVWFVFEGQPWHGVNIGDNQILRCRRIKG